jgi:membrane associated rhomboid family serine protease
MSNFRYTRPEAMPPIVKNLIFINALVFVAQLTMGKQFNLTEHITLYPLMPRQLLDIVQNSPSLQPYYGFQPYQIATHLFAHSTASPFHLIFNMFALWMFGRVLENVWGPKRFLLFYILCGVGAAACHLTIQYIRCQELLQAVQVYGADSAQATALTGALSPALGASGAVMGIMAAFAYTFPNTELFIMFLPVPVKAKWAVLGYVAIDLLGGLGVYTDNVAHFAHLGGALTGFIIVLIWSKTNRRRFY